MKSTGGNEINMIDEEQEYDLMNNETASISTNKYRTAGFSEPSIQADRVSDRIDR